MFQCEFPSDFQCGCHIVQSAKPETRKWMTTRCTQTSLLEIIPSHVVPVACAMVKDSLAISLVECRFYNYDSTKRDFGTNLCMGKLLWFDAQNLVFLWMECFCAWDLFVVVWPWAHFDDFSTSKFFGSQFSWMDWLLEVRQASKWFSSLKWLV